MAPPGRSALICNPTTGAGAGALEDPVDPAQDYTTRLRATAAFKPQQIQMAIYIMARTPYSY